MNPFNNPKPNATVIPSSFDSSGGWIIPLDAAGFQALHEFFGEIPELLIPFDRKGYIVEPHQSADLAEHLRACNVTWEIVRWPHRFAS